METITIEFFGQNGNSNAKAFLRNTKKHIIYADGYSGMHQDGTEFHLKLGDSHTPATVTIKGENIEKHVARAEKYADM